MSAWLERIRRNTSIQAGEGVMLGFHYAVVYEEGFSY
jgi:hypothetical protein